MNDLTAQTLKRRLELKQQMNIQPPSMEELAGQEQEFEQELTQTEKTIAGLTELKLNEFFDISENSPYFSFLSHIYRRATAVVGDPENEVTDFEGVIDAYILPILEDLGSKGYLKDAKLPVLINNAFVVATNYKYDESLRQYALDNKPEGKPAPKKQFTSEKVYKATVPQLEARVEKLERTVKILLNGYIDG